MFGRPLAGAALGDVPSMMEEIDQKTTQNHGFNSSEDASSDRHQGSIRFADHLNTMLRMGIPAGRSRRKGISLSRQLAPGDSGRERLSRGSTCPIIHLP